MADELGREGASFSAILGHEGAKAHLQAALSSGQMSHAYLIEGIPGVGKKTLARAFVKALLCENGNGESCGKCSSCQSFEHGNHPDIKRIRPAEDKNSISVKQVRDELVKDMSIRPYGSRYKVYIIEDADKLTVEAQNAMLKTIEEPPAYGLILLIAESAASFLPTILSRCVRVTLQPLSNQLVRQGLEQRGIESGKASIAAAFSQGSLGQALELCENAEFEEIRQALFQFLAQIPQLSQLEILRGASLWDQYKTEQETLFSLLLIWYRDLLVYQETEDSQRLLCVDQLAAVQQAAAHYSKEKLIQLIDRIVDIHRKIKANGNAALAIDCLLKDLK